jgi:peptidoglycan hydrolase-like protein with peptidoglycan-binding domain
MAYHDLRNEPQSIRYIQKVLRDLNYIDTGKASIPINGVYGTSTKEGIRNFQALYNLKPTGIVDAETWSLLSSVYKAQTTEAQLARSVHIFPKYNEYEVTPGVKDNLVYVIQHMLESVLALYYDYYGIPLNGIYDEATKEGVKIFQRANLLDDTGLMNAETFNKLADEYERSNSLKT